MLSIRHPELFGGLGISPYSSRGSVGNIFEVEFLMVLCPILFIYFMVKEYGTLLKCFHNT